MSLGMRTKVVAALGLSLGIHAVIFAGFAPGEEEVRIAGGGAMEIAALGNDFEDMLSAGGILQPVDGDDAVKPATAETVQPVETQETERPVETEALKSLETAETVDMAEAEPVERTEPVETTQAVAALPEVEPVETEESREAALPEAEAVLDLPVTDAAKPVEMASLPPADAVPVPEPSPRAAERTPDRIEADKPENAAPARPKKIEAAPEKAEKARETKKPKKVTTQGAGTGNASRDARKGTAEGRREATGARTRNAGLPGAANGNAQASNYPGKVRAKIGRTRRHRAGGRGTVVVRFSIAGNGSLGSVGIARSSGNNAADKSALDHIRRAAPFPPPPPGAQRTFSVPLKVEG